jgi:hypothetical protein
MQSREFPGADSAGSLLTPPDHVVRRRGDVSQLIRCIVFPVKGDGDCVVGNRPDR